MILVSAQVSGQAVITESSLAVQEAAPARLYVYWTSPWSPPDPRREFPELVATSGYDEHVLFVIFFRESEARPKLYSAKSASEDGVHGWNLTQADVELDWKVRSRLTHTLMLLRYLYAVPLDIITAPFQVIALGAFGAG